MATVQERLLTAEEFAHLPSPKDGSRQELVRGKVVDMPPPPGFRHSKELFHVAKILDSFVEENGLGQIIPETGMVTHRDPDSVRGPDIAYWSVERLPLDEEPLVYPNVAADLCVEILSPSDRPGEVRAKVREYLNGGVRMVWIVDPEDRTITTYETAEEGRVLHEEATLDGGEVLQGFERIVREMFP